jgi:hypothetical protein
MFISQLTFPILLALKPCLCRNACPHKVTRRRGYVQAGGLLIFARPAHYLIASPPGLLGMPTRLLGIHPKLYPVMLKSIGYQNKLLPYHVKVRRVSKVILTLSGQGIQGTISKIYSINLKCTGYQGKVCRVSRQTSTLSCYSP